MDFSRLKTSCKGVVEPLDNALVAVKAGVAVADNFAVALHFFRNGAHEFAAGVDLK